MGSLDVSGARNEVSVSLKLARSLPLGCAMVRGLFYGKFKTFGREFACLPPHTEATWQKDILGGPQPTRQLANHVAQVEIS